MSEIITKIVGIAATTIVLPLIVFAMQRLSAWLKTKANAIKYTACMSRVNTLVSDVLKMISQTVVDDLKKSGSFDKEAQVAALERAKGLIIDSMSEEVKKHITECYGDIEKWVNIKIESAIYEANTLKK